MRRIARQVHGTWRNDRHPILADTAQRQAGIDALSGSVDWILQVDNDEVLPDPHALLDALDWLSGEAGIEWPMRVLYRRLRDGRYLQVVGRHGETVYEYPGSVVVRPGTRLVDARRHEGRFLRVVVRGDGSSLQLARAPEPAERRGGEIDADAAIVHNSWAKTRPQVWRKTRSWGHEAGLKGTVYYLTRWLPAPLTWRWMRDFHPFAKGLWSRLGVVRLPAGSWCPPTPLLHEALGVAELVAEVLVARADGLGRVPAHDRVRARRPW